MRYKLFSALAAVGLLVLSVSSLAAPHTSVAPYAAAGMPAALPDLSPQPRETLIDQAITGLLTRYHYGNESLNNALSRKILHQYIETLDPNRGYFLQSDIDGFSKYADKLDDAIRNGNLHPAFDIYNVYQKRVSQRIDYALSILTKEPDFTVKESYTYDRSKAPWEKNQADMDNLWRRRVKSDALGLLLAGKSWKQTATILGKRYRNFEHRASQITNKDVFDLFMNAYTAALDPHTDYFSPDQSQQFQIEMSLKLQGIGAALVTDGEYTKVQRIIPGGPAARSKLLHPDDRITGVAQGDKGDMVDVVGWRLDDVVSLIRGTKGTVVRLQILPAGAAPGSPEKVLRLVRDTVKLEAQAAHQHILKFNYLKGPTPSSAIITDGKTTCRSDTPCKICGKNPMGKKTCAVHRGPLDTYKIGVITIPSFYRDFQGQAEGEKNFASTTRDVRRLLKQLEAEHVDGVIIDLRNNGGGSLQEADDLTGLFVPHGPVVQIRDSDGKVRVQNDDDSNVVYRGPLAVLVNRFTASASEIFTAAIQDYHRGVVIGSQTYGKGTVQTLIDLNRIVPGDGNAGQLKLTIEKFYRINGASTQRKGVTPDILLPSAIDPKEFGEETHESALPWDQIPPTDYTVLHLGLDKALNKLRARHDARIAHSDAWHLYLKELQAYQAQRDEKSVSLVLTERKQERVKHDKERLALANAWRKLEGLPPAANLEDAYKLAQKDNESKNGKSAQSGKTSPSSNVPVAGHGVDSGLQLPDVVLNTAALTVIDMKQIGVGSLPTD